MLWEIKKKSADAMYEWSLRDDEFWAVLVDNLPKAQIKDFTIDFCGVNYVDDLTDIVCNESWFMWLKVS